MRKSLLGSLITLLLLVIVAVPGFAHEQQHQGAGMMKHPKSEMRHMKMMDDQGMACMVSDGSMASKMDKMTCMLTGKMSMKQGGMQGGMRGMMKKVFYLDRIAELGLQKDQIKRLKGIHSACRRDNLRAATEVRIARFDLKDLLEGNWTLEAAEELIHKIATLEGDMKVRHLTAVKAALNVLSKEQRVQLSADESPESLFEN